MSFSDAYAKALSGSGKSSTTNLGGAQSILDSFKPGQYSQINTQIAAKQPKVQTQTQTNSTSQPKQGTSLFSKLVNGGKQVVDTSGKAVRAVARPVIDVASGQGGKLTHDTAQLGSDVTGGSANYLTNTAIVNPLRETAAQVTGNKQALANAKQKSNVTLGLGTQGTNVKSGAITLGANAILAGSSLLGGQETAGLKNIFKNGLTNAAKKIATDAGLGSAGNAAYTLSQNPKATAKDIRKSAIIGGAFGAGAPAGADLTGAGFSKLVDKSHIPATRELITNTKVNSLLDKVRSSASSSVPITGRVNSIPEAELVKAPVATPPLESLPRVGAAIEPKPQVSATASKGSLPENHAAYFNTTDKTKTLPVSDLVSSKTPKQNAPGAANAKQLMKQAANGEIPKRDPILVHTGKDGTNTVLDGNATLTTAQKQGWNTLPVDKVTSDVKPGAMHVDSTKRLIAQAKAEDPQFQSNISDVAKSLGTDYHPGSVKGTGRTLTKVMDDYGGDHTQVKDTIRGTMVLHDHSPAGIKRAVDAIKEKYPRVTVKNGYEKASSGYRDVKVTVETPTGHKGEIILATPEMLAAKHDLGGHDMYKTARDASQTRTVREKATNDMQKLYDKAHADANSRLASSGDLPNSVSSTDKALAGEITSEPSRTTPTSLETPDKTTVSESKPSLVGRTASTTSSGVKNSVRGSSILSTIADKEEKSKLKLNEKGSGEQKTNTQGTSLVSKTKSESKTLTPVQTAHLPDIGGYTHSSDMAKDYADMLRGQEQQVRGGQLLDDGANGKTRISEHSKFYREFYKENKKAPTKADYLEQAQRELTSGKDAFGATKDYQILLKREGQPLPTPGLNVTPMKNVGWTKTSKLARGVEAKAVEAKLTKSLGLLPQYSKVNMKEQGRLAVDLLQNDQQKAIDIALGKEVPPAHILPESVYTAVESKALATGDVDLIRALANSHLVSEATAMGQRIRALGERDTNSPVTAIKNVQKARTQAFEAKNKTTITKAVNKEVQAIRAAKPKVTRESVTSFIDSLKC